MKKPVHQIPQRGAFAANIDDLIERFPLLAEQLAATAYEGDAPGSRATATLLIFAQDLSWKAVLRDRQEQRALWVSCLTLMDLFAVLESALGDPAAVWRDDRVSGAAEAKRQKPGK